MSFDKDRQVSSFDNVTNQLLYKEADDVKNQLLS